MLAVNSSVLADIAVPKAKGILIQTSQDFPDFDFYIGSIPSKRTYGPKGGTEFFYEQLELSAVSLTSKTPYFALNNFGYDQVIFFLAIKKEVKPPESSELKTKVISAIKNKTGEGVYFFFINSSAESEQGESKLSVVYTIESIDNSGIKTSRTLDDSFSPYFFKFSYVASGLCLTGLIIGIGLIYLFLRKRKTKK